MQEKDTEVNVGWHRETEGLGHCLEVQLLHIKQPLLFVAGIGSHEPFVGFLRTLVQEVVLADEQLQLSGDIN